MSEMLPRLTWQRNILRLRNPFRLAYGVSETRQAFWIRLADDAGWGEAAIPPYYGIDDASMIAMWEAAARRTEPFPDDPAQIEAWVGSSGPAPARCALDLALHDRIAWLRGVPLHELLDLPAPVPLRTSFTIAISEPDEMAMVKDVGKGTGAGRSRSSCRGTPCSRAMRSCSARSSAQRAGAGPELPTHASICVGSSGKGSVRRVAASHIAIIDASSMP